MQELAGVAVVFGIVVGILWMAMPFILLTINGNLKRSTQQQRRLETIMRLHAGIKKCKNCDRLKDGDYTKCPQCGKEEFV